MGVAKVRIMLILTYAILGSFFVRPQGQAVLFVDAHGSLLHIIIHWRIIVVMVVNDGVVVFVVVVDVVGVADVVGLRLFHALVHFTVQGVC